MSNRDEAIRVIQEQTVVSGLATSQHIVRKLAEAGLLAPDLPEPGKAWNDDEAPLMWKITDDFNPLAVVLEERLPDTPVQLETFRTIVKRLTIKQARRAAHALLAAADAAEVKNEHAE